MKWIFSPKQIFALTWWKKYPKLKGIICEGSIRSGKTVALSLSFVQWAMENFNGGVFALCGKTIASFRRNVLHGLKEYAFDMGLVLEDHKTENLIVMKNDLGVTNLFYIFGGLNEKSQDLIQGITLSGIFFDEVALMPESFVSQGIGRCSVDGAKVFMNCNPSDPQHFIKKQYIDGHRHKGFIHMHFNLEDNWSLSEERKRFYRNAWTGVFYRRYILGEWCAAEGAIYQIFSENRDRYFIENIPPLTRINVGLDYGASKSRTALICTGLTADRKLIALCESHLEGTHDPDRIYAFVLSFLQRAQKIIGRRPQTLWCDYGALGQVLTKGLKLYLPKHECAIRIEDCKKGSIIDRINLTCKLMGEGRYFMTRHCVQLAQAFETAVWEDGKVDVRLDNGSSDIDSLDAFEYSFYSFADTILC